jgi:tRNA A-37 threonylcarbamoyl transferase component Bud32
VGDSETPLTGGWVTQDVVRVGDTVRRPPSPNSAFVERLLVHLEEVGFEAAPRFLGFDEQGRQILTFIEGHVPSDCRAMVWEDTQLEAAATLLRGYHDVTTATDLAEGDIVCHNDFGPWNLVWRDGRPVAIIDFDNAAPGKRLDDLGYATWKHLNLGLVELPAREQRRRLRLMAAAYGIAADRALIDSIHRAQARMQRRVEAATAGAPRTVALAQRQAGRAWLADATDNLG